MADSKTLLTQITRSGGCGCKVPPDLLSSLLSMVPLGQISGAFSNDGSIRDDAAIVPISSNQSLVFSTDFSTPLVDSPIDFGRISAANALSDVYAMGATPIMALAILGVPISRLSVSEIAEIMKGGSAVCAAAGVAISGGHTIDLIEPIYGLAVAGIVDTANIRRLSDGKHGDVLILTKPLGSGILAAAQKMGNLSAAEYEVLLNHAVQLNNVGIELAKTSGVNAMTDVTGFGLAGHLLNICSQSGLSAEIALESIPCIPFAVSYAKQGVETGASIRNWAAYSDQLVWPTSAADWQRILVSDPQSNGGLLFSCEPRIASHVLNRLRQTGYISAEKIGVLSKSEPSQVTRASFQ